MTKAKLGLTLIEILGLFLVLAVLAAIFFPVFACACGGSPATTCLSDLKQSGLAAQMYASDFDNRLPRSDAWMDRLMPYAANERIFHDIEGIKKGEFGYAFRKSASTLNLEVLKDQAAFVMVFDSSLKERNATSELWSLPNPGRHAGGDNLCFADSHVKRLKLADDTNLVNPSPMQTALIADDNAGPWQNRPSPKPRH